MLVITPVLAPATFTVAPITGAPEASLTEPRTETSWADRLVTINIMTKVRHTLNLRAMFVDNFVIDPLNKDDNKFSNSSVRLNNFIKLRPKYS